MPYRSNVRRGLSQIRALKIGEMQIRALKLGLTQIRALKFGPTQIRALKFGPRQIRALKPGVSQICALELRAIFLLNPSSPHALSHLNVASRRSARKRTAP